MRDRTLYEILHCESLRSETCNFARQKGLKRIGKVLKCRNYQINFRSSLAAWLCQWARYWFAENQRATVSLIELIRLISRCIVAAARSQNRKVVAAFAKSQNSSRWVCRGMILHLHYIVSEEFFLDYKFSILSCREDLFVLSRQNFTLN